MILFIPDVEYNISTMINKYIRMIKIGKNIINVLLLQFLLLMNSLLHYYHH